MLCLLALLRLLVLVEIWSMTPPPPGTEVWVSALVVLMCHGYTHRQTIRVMVV